MPQDFFYSHFSLSIVFVVVCICHSWIYDQNWQPFFSLIILGISRALFILGITVSFIIRSTYRIFKIEAFQSIHCCHFVSTLLSHIKKLSARNILQTFNVFSKLGCDYIEFFSFFRRRHMLIHHWSYFIA